MCVSAQNQCEVQHIYVRLMQYSSAAASQENCVLCFTLRLIFIFLTLFILLVNMDILSVGTAVLSSCLSYCTNKLDV